MIYFLPPYSLFRVCCRGYDVIGIITLLGVGITTLLGVGIITLLGVGIITLLGVGIITLLAVGIITLLGVGIITLLGVGIITLLGVGIITLLGVGIITLLVVGIIYGGGWRALTMDQLLKEGFVTSFIIFISLTLRVFFSLTSLTSLISHPNRSPNLSAAHVL